MEIRDIWNARFVLILPMVHEFCRWNSHSEISGHKHRSFTIDVTFELKVVFIKRC
jgi:hypothetical protein